MLLVPLRPLQLVIPMLGAALCLCAGCPDDLLANAPCEEDENCPDDLVCSDDGICVDEADLEGDEGEGEGDEGEGEGEGEGEEGEGEGEGEEGEGEGGDQDCSPGEIEISSTEELAIFAGCETIEGDIVIVGDGVASLAALGDVATVDGNIAFVDLGEADEVEALAGLSFVSGDLEINGDDADEIIDALASLDEVGDDLRIADTDIITLRGFGGLGAIGGDLVFVGNDFLESFGDGTFDSLEVIGESVVAENNPQLPLCLLESLAAIADGEPALDDRGGNNDEAICG